LYLAVVMDLFSRKIVGWAMAPLPNWSAPRCRWRSPSAAHRALLERRGLRASMSRRGNCWDNAVMERFFLNLKTERVWQRDYANHAEATCDVTEYIVGFYSSVRLHSKLGYLSPTAYERDMAEKHPIGVSENT
jgi:putative transposase